MASMTFRNINYGKMLYEALRNYYAVNTGGDLSMLYEILICYLQPLQLPFNNYDTFRRLYEIVANCKYQIGQLTNVLNYIYDNIQKRIFISQSVVNIPSAPKFQYKSNLQATKFGSITPCQVRKFNDPAYTSETIFNVPNGISIPAITATIEMIKIDGPSYTIQTF